MVALKEEKKKQMAAMEELRREVDVFINSFLKQEGLEDLPCISLHLPASPQYLPCISPISSSSRRASRTTRRRC